MTNHFLWINVFANLHVQVRMFLWLDLSYTVKCEHCLITTNWKGF